SCSSGRGPATPPLCVRQHQSPHPHGPSASVSPPPLQASSTSRTVTPVRIPLTLARKPPPLRPRGSCPHGDAAARSTPPLISVRTRIAGTGVGRDGGISAPTAIPMGGAG